MTGHLPSSTEQARDVAAGIRRRATTEKLSPQQRQGADDLRRLPHQQGRPTWTTPPHSPTAGRSPPASSKAPAATSSRTEWTSPAPDGVSTAPKPILKLRALRSNGDFDDYWRFHQSREQQRVHRSRYADNVIPRAA